MVPSAALMMLGIGHFWKKAIQFPVRVLPNRFLLNDWITRRSTGEFIPLSDPHLILPT
jgi:hypothetical protein